MRLRQVVADEAVDAEDQDAFHVGGSICEEAQHSTIAAVGEPCVAVAVGAEPARARAPRGLEPRAQDHAPAAALVGERAGDTGGATARTRLWISAALFDQSMRPSSGLRPPK